MGFLFMLAEWQRHGFRAKSLQRMMLNSETLRVPHPITNSFFPMFLGCSRIDPGFRCHIDKKYHKIISVVDFMIASGVSGPAAVVQACEIFASGNARQWLKVAGQFKAELVEDCLLSRPQQLDGIIAEFGSFVGYSCVRMTWRSGCRAKVVSLESDAVHVTIARYVIAQAQCCREAEVSPGMAHDSVRRLVDEWGRDAISFAFMDHRGTRFHVDLKHLESLRALGPGAKFLADNTLKPGAPENLWHFLQCPDRHASTSWSLPEFASHSCEDWMSASDCLP